MILILDDFYADVAAVRLTSPDPSNNNSLEVSNLVAITEETPLSSTAGEPFITGGFKINKNKKVQAAEHTDKCSENGAPLAVSVFLLSKEVEHGIQTNACRNVEENHRRGRRLFPLRS
jgi:hypothetical protein